MNRFTLFLGAAAFALGLVGAAPARAQSPIVIKFSHVVTDAAPKGKAAQRFKELAEKYTNGKVKVEIYPNSTLYKDAEEMQALQLGAVQMLAPSTAKFSTLGVKEFEVLDLPFLFKDQETYDRVINGKLGNDLLAKLDGKGVKGLAYWDNGFYVISANKPLIKPSDLQGLKIRISGSKIDEMTLRSLGALPQIMAFSELYQALQSGVVDGAQNTPSNYTTQKLNEVQSNITNLRHVHLQYAVIVNKAFWDGLPQDIRTELNKAMAEATTYNNENSQADNAQALQEIIKTGKTDVHQPTPEEMKVWKGAMLPIYKQAASRIGQPIIDEAVKEAGVEVK
ncbi:MAG: DctP family TRAP transporter solute-binding subunit [Acetobacteraceae bacterium]|nr:DctP family TRAP transporter solute-binding subunit [Acetobacteraceae bacterium]